MTGQRIVEALVAEIAIKRATPRVFLLNEQGVPILWPSSGEIMLPAALAALVDMYFAQDPARRERFSELVDVHGAQTIVRIMPYDGDGAKRFALVFEPFALRSRANEEPRPISRGSSPTRSVHPNEKP